jgi:hypothetical protein
VSRQAEPHLHHDESQVDRRTGGKRPTTPPGLAWSWTVVMAVPMAMLMTMAMPVPMAMPLALAMPGRLRVIVMRRLHGWLTMARAIRRRQAYFTNW